LSQVLVIEDSPAIALLLRRRLEMAGHTVRVADAGESALNDLARGPTPEVVLADVILPGIDGIDTLNRIKASHPKLPVIMVTGQDLDPSSHRAAEAVFTKPIDFGRLLETIEALAAGDLDPDA
jgi:CheY-like chemotaxis protein